MRRPVASLFLLAVVIAAHAASLPAQSRAEVDALLANLQASGCTFNRNGSWYSASEAQAHLMKKLEYLEDKGLVDSAEQFIERAASGSSLSGKPYLVKCGATPPVESRTWLSTQLKSLRNQAPAAASK